MPIYYQKIYSCIKGKNVISNLGEQEKFLGPDNEHLFLTDTNEESFHIWKLSNWRHVGSSLGGT